MSYPMIEFCFAFTSPSTNIDSEHVLSIKRTADLNFEWNFCKTASEVTRMYLDEQSVYLNLRKLFDLLYWDSYPYSHFRVVFPGFPSAYITMNNARAALPYIEELMSTVFNNSPVTVPLVTDNNQESDMVDTDEDQKDSDESDEDEEESDEVDDMPPLIPIRNLYYFCSPKRSSTNPVTPSAPPRIRRVQNEIIDNTGPCNNTRASKKRKFDESTKEPTHLFFD